MKKKVVVIVEVVVEMLLMIVVISESINDGEGGRVCRRSGGCDGCFIKRRRK